MGCSEEIGQALDKKNLFVHLTVMSSPNQLQLHLAQALTECGTAAPWQVPKTSWGGLMEPLHLGESEHSSQLFAGCHPAGTLRFFRYGPGVSLCFVLLGSLVASCAPKHCCCHR